MTIDSSLKQVVRSATEPTGPHPAILPLLTDLLFADNSLSAWQSLTHPMKGLIKEEFASQQLAELAAPLSAIGSLLRGDDAPGTSSLPTRLLTALKILEANSSLFFLPQATPHERLTRLPLFTPLAVLHLFILRLLHTLAFTTDNPTIEHTSHTCDTTARCYIAYAQQSVADAVTWRTDQLDITCTPMRSATHGGPNLLITCVDTLTSQTIVDELCTAYPGISNNRLQRTVDRISLHEERLYHKAALFWETQVLDVLSEWNEQEKKRPAPTAPNSINERLDDALYLIIQDMYGSMAGFQ